MARPTTGTIIPHVGRDGRTYRSLRFTAYGERRYVALGPVSASEAQNALRHVLADVERGIWRPAVAARPEPEAVTFHQFAERWWLLNEARWRPKTIRDYRWKLEHHLIPAFGERLLRDISGSDVKSYTAGKLKSGALSRRSINATITLFAGILEDARDEGLIEDNPARGKRRKVPEHRPERSYLDTAGQIQALLLAARQLDREAREDRRHVERHAILDTLTLAGLRIGELCNLRWRDVDLAAGWLRVGEAKTDAGTRKVKLRGALRDVLLRMRAEGVRQEAYVFATRAGRRPSGDNIRSRVLRVAVRRANENLAGEGLPPLPERLTPHSLRRTFASVLYALGEDPGVVMDEMGHTDPALALRIYRQSMRRGEAERAALRALVDGADLADGLPEPVRIARKSGQSEAAPAAS